MNASQVSREFSTPSYEITINDNKGDTFGEKISIEQREALPHLAVSGSLTGGTASGQVGSDKLDSLVKSLCRSN